MPPEPAPGRTVKRCASPMLRGAFNRSIASRERRNKVGKMITMTGASTIGVFVLGIMIAGEKAEASNPNHHFVLRLQGVEPGDKTDYVTGTRDENNNTLKCHLTSSFILSPKSENDIQKHIDEQVPWWLKDLQQRGERACDLLKGVSQLDYEQKPNDPRARELLQGQNTAIQKMCTEQPPSEANIRSMLRSTIAVENATCDVHSMTYDMDFTKHFDVNKIICVHNSGEPGLMCGDIEIDTLTQTTNNPSNWTYEVKVINTKPGGLFCPKPEYTQKFTSSFQKGERSCSWVTIN